MPLPKDIFSPAFKVPETESSSKSLDKYFREAATRYSLPESLIRAVAEQESNYNPEAISPAGASGVMQLMPETAMELGVTNVFDPRQNILGGAKYLKQNLDKLGSIPLTIAAYKAGPGAVKKAGGIPGPSAAGGFDAYVMENTEDYVKKVLDRKSKLRPKIMPKLPKDIFGLPKKRGMVQPGGALLGEIPEEPITRKPPRAPVAEEMPEGAIPFTPPEQKYSMEEPFVHPSLVEGAPKEPKRLTKAAREAVVKPAVGAVRAYASVVPPATVGLFTTPVRALSAVAAAAEDLFTYGGAANKETMKSALKEGWRGERDVFGASAVAWDKLAEESSDIIAGERTTSGEQYQRYLANQILTAAMITWGGAGLAKAVPKMQETATIAGKNLLDKTKITKTMKLTPDELRNVRQAHQGFAGKTIESLTPKEKSFYNAALADADEMRALALRKGSRKELVYPWESPWAKRLKAVTKKTKPPKMPEILLAGGKRVKQPPTLKKPTPPKPPPPKKPVTEQAGFVKFPEINWQSAKSKVPPAAKKAYESAVINKQIKAAESARAINTVMRKTTPQQREAITFLIEKTGVPKELKRPDLEAQFKDSKNLAHLKSVAGKVEKHYKKALVGMADVWPNLTDIQKENYVTHMWETKTKKDVKSTVTRLNTQMPFLKKRKIPTYEEGIKLGLVPKTLDVAKIMHIYDQYAISSAENIKLVEALMALEDDAGVKLIQRIDKAPQDWKYIDHPVLRRAAAVGQAEINVPVKSFETVIKENIEKIITIERASGGVTKDVSKPMKKMEGVMTHALESRGMTEGEARAYLGRLKSAYAGAEVVGGDEKITEVINKKVVPIIKEINSRYKVKVPVLMKLPVKYHPDLDPLMQATFGRPFEAGGAAGTALRFAETVNAFLKKTQLSVSLFHHMALGETAVATLGPGKTAQIALGLGEKGVERFVPAAKIYRALVKGQYDIYKKMPLTKDAIRHGLTIGAISDVQRTRVQKTLQGLEDDLSKLHKAFGLPVKAISKANDLWDKALWDYYHNNLKLYGYEHLVGNALGKMKNPTQGKIAAVKREVASFINDTFGGQNWELAMTNPKTLQLAQFFLLSPDWTLSTIRQAISPTGLGAVHKESAALRKKMGKAFWFRAAFYFGTTINGLNYILTKADDAEQRGVSLKKGDGKFLWENDPGHKTHLFVGRYDDGSKRYIRWGKQFRELPELIYDQYAMQVSPLTAAKHKLGGKMSPGLQLMSVLFTGSTPSGYEYRDLKDSKGWQWAAAAAKHIVTSGIPFALKTTIDETKEFHLTDLAFPSSKGMTYYKAKSLFKYAILKKRPEKVEAVFKAATENNLNGWKIFGNAIRELKMEAQAEIGRKVRAEDITEGKTYAEIRALSKEEARKAQRQAIINDWDWALDAAKERYNAFHEEQRLLSQLVEE